MIDIFSHKQIICDHCGFGYFCAEFGGEATIVCPACGEINIIPAPPSAPIVEPNETAALSHAEACPPETRLTEFPDLLFRQPELETQVPCAVESCPLLTGNESVNTAAAVIDQLGLRVLKRKRRRKIILLWTVMLQVCVLCGLGLFIAKAHWIPETVHIQTVSSIVPIVDEEIIDVPSPVLPLTAIHPPLLEDHLVRSAPVLNNEPLAPTIEPQLPAVTQKVAPFEVSHSGQSAPDNGITPDSPQPYEVPQAVQETFTPNSDPVVSDLEILPPPLPMEQVTLDTADNLLETAEAALPDHPENSIEQAVRAAKIYDQFGHSYPASMYWVLGSAFASLSWGESLLEASPAVKTMELSPDNRYLLTQLADKKVWLWDLQNITQDQTGYILDQGSAEYVKFVFTPDLRWIIGGQKDGTIRIWDMTLKNPAETYVTFTERIPDLQDIQISSNGQWLAAFGHAPLHMVRANQLPHGKSVQQVNYQRTDRVEQFSSSPYPVLLWNLRQMASGIVPMAITIPSMPQPAQVVRFSPHSDRIAVGRRDSVVRVYDLTPRGISEEPFILRGHQLGITQIAFAPNGQWIATGSQDNTVRLWNLASSKVTPESTTLYGHVGWIKSLTIDSAGEHVFSGSYDRTIRIWNIKHNHIGTALKEEPIVLETNQGIPETLSITPDGDKMIILGKEGSLGIYHLPSVLASKAEEISQAISFHNSKLSISKCQITSDNQLLIFCYNHLTDPTNNGIRLWSLQSKTLIPAE